ncbi:MAG: TetR/AcrR family transcriptional regulator [Deltaproteobacteria bacterium]
MIQTRTKTKKDVVTEFRTSEILAAAHRVFGDKGFHAATIDEVARAANVAKGTVYLYYRSKHDLYWAALEVGIRNMLSRTKANIDRARSTEEKIHAFIETKVRYFDENREFFRIYYSEFGNVLTHPAESRRDFTRLYRSQAQMLEAVLERGLRRKEVRCTRSDSTALAISELTRGLIIHRLLGWSKARVEDDIRFLFEFVQKGIGRS